MLRASQRQFGNCLRVADEVARDIGGGGAVLRRIGPVPEIARPGVIHRPGRQQPVAHVAHAGIAGFEQLAVLAGVAKANQFIQEREDHRHAPGLLVVLPGSGFRVGVTRPRSGIGIEIAPGGEQVPPMLRGLQPAPVAGDLIRAQQGPVPYWR